jgi:hypothetical protein
VSFINGYAVASLDSRVTREAIVAEYDCDADDLDCLHAALGADLLPGNDSATVQAVAYWDGNVSAEKEGLHDCSVQARWPGRSC